MLEYFGCEGDDFHVLGTDFAGHRAEDTCATEFAVILEKNAGIVVETDIGTVRAAYLFLGSNYHGAGNGTFLDIRAGKGVLDGYDDDIAKRGIASSGATEDVDAEDFLSARIVGNGEA